MCLAAACVIVVPGPSLVVDVPRGATVLDAAHNLHKDIAARLHRHGLVKFRVERLILRIDLFDAEFSHGIAQHLQGQLSAMIARSSALLIT